MVSFELVCEHEKANAEGICVRQNGENLCLPPVWFWFSVALVLRMPLVGALSWGGDCVSLMDRRWMGNELRFCNEDEG